MDLKILKTNTEDQGKEGVVNHISLLRGVMIQSGQRGEQGVRKRGDESSESSSRLARKGSRGTGRRARVSLPPGHGDTLHTGGMSHREAGQQDRKGVNAAARTLKL